MIDRLQEQGPCVLGISTSVDDNGGLSRGLGFTPPHRHFATTKSDPTKNVTQTYLLELFNGTRVDTTALVDQVTYHAFRECVSFQ